MVVSLKRSAEVIKQKSRTNPDSSKNISSGHSIWDQSVDMEDGSPKGDSSGKAQVEWVQCDACKKWRTLPPPDHPKYPSALDEDKGWACAMNTWAPHLANCQVPEESMLSPTAIKIKIWLRRLRTGDRYESRNNLKPVYDKKSAGTTSITTVPVDWIRCCSPLCGKWRSCLRTMNGDDVQAIQVIATRSSVSLTMISNTYVASVVLLDGQLG